MANQTDNQLDLAVEKVLDSLDEVTADWSLTDRIAVCEMLQSGFGTLIAVDREALRRSAGVKR